MSNLKAFNGSELHGFNQSELSARGLGGPDIYVENLTLPNLTLLGGSARLYYYRSRFIFFNVLYKPAWYQYASPLVTDIRFTTYFLTKSFQEAYGLGPGPAGIEIGRGTISCINADTFVEFDPVNDTMASHPGWSTDFSPRPSPWPTSLSGTGGLTGVGYPTVTGDTGFPSGAYDAFVSSYSPGWVDTVPSEPISNFDPTTETVLPHVRDGLWLEPYSGIPASQTYNIAGFVIHPWGRDEILCGVFFGSPWVFTMNNQSIAAVFRGSFFGLSERYIKRNYAGPIP